MYPNLRKLVAEEIALPKSTAAEIDAETATLFAEMKAYSKTDIWQSEYALYMGEDQLTADEREELSNDIETREADGETGIRKIIDAHMYVQASPFLDFQMRRDVFMDIEHDAREYLAPKLFKAFEADNVSA
jgi:hypothetical protein